MSKGVKYFLIAAVVIILLFFFFSEESSKTTTKKKGSEKESKKDEEPSCVQISKEEFERLKTHEKERIVSESFWWAAWQKDAFVRKHRQDALKNGVPDIFHDIMHHGAWVEAYGKLIADGKCPPEG